MLGLSAIGSKTRRELELAAQEANSGAGDMSSRNRLLLDHDKPRSYDGALWTAAFALRRWRIGRWRRSWTTLGLEQVCVVRHGIHCDRLRAGERVNRGNHGVLVGGILVDDSDVALASIGNKYQFSRRIPSQGVHARAVLDIGYDFARAWINDDGCIVAT